MTARETGEEGSEYFNDEGHRILTQTLKSFLEQL